ncbi:MAG TPA: hypothetical protein VIM98_05175 [Dyella sp.]|uniref:hypothetical protein n=1 Tax=Dyella sp. TaxID=1869338 RepID=UPI002F94886B
MQGMAKFKVLMALAMSAGWIHAEDNPGSLGENYQPLVAMQGCDEFPPNGYLWVELRYVYSPAACYGKWLYIYESHLDKPAGSQMTICAPLAFPWSVPSNWLKVGEVVSAKCPRQGPGNVGLAWIVQKGY